MNNLQLPAPMKKEDQKSIKSNLNLLASKTEKYDELILALVKRKLIEQPEKDRLEKLPTKHKRCSELFLLMLTKGYDAFELLHEALLESGNDSVAEILKPDETTTNSASTQNMTTSTPIPKPRQRTTSQVDVDVEVQESHIADIVDVLDATIDHFEWPLIVLDLIDSPVLRQQLDSLPSTTPYEVLFEKTLQLWVKSNGSRATFNVLLKVLDSRKQEQTADALKKKSLKIFRDQV